MFIELSRKYGTVLIADNMHFFAFLLKEADQPFNDRRLSRRRKTRYKEERHVLQ